MFRWNSEVILDLHPLGQKITLSCREVERRKRTPTTVKGGPVGPESIEQTTPEQPSQFETPPAALPVHEKSGDVAIYLVEFRGSRKDHYRDPYHLPIRIGDRVIVQVERGEDLGRVVLRPSPKDAAAAKVKPLPILRIAGKTALE